MLIGLGGIIQLVNLNNREARSKKFNRQAFYLAEAGLERAIAQLNQNAAYTAETIALPNPGAAGVPTIGQTVIAVSGSGNSRTITATGYAPSQSQPLATAAVRVQATGTAGGQGTPITFNYGVQVGDQGVEMGNNSSISGNVFSNGEVEGATNTAISGSVISAGAGGEVENFYELGIAGHVTAHKVERVRVAGNVKGRTCKNSIISGNLAADTVQSCTVTGQITPGVADTPPQPLPITNEQINAWKQAAEAGGLQNGDLTIATNTSLGPKKIGGNLTISNNIILTMTGTLWVTGTLSVGNGARIRLAPSFGTNDGVLVTDGPIHIDNNMITEGSGQPSSYLMLLSTNNGTGHHGSAIDLHNNARGAILYASAGEIHLHNNVVIKQATAVGLELAANARLTFESGIQNSNFVDVITSGAWMIVKGTYQRL